LFITQHIVGLAKTLELGLGFRIVGVFVGVELGISQGKRVIIYMKQDDRKGTNKTQEAMNEQVRECSSPSFSIHQIPPAVHISSRRSTYLERHFPIGFLQLDIIGVGGNSQ
jgi:hypothetical protein